MVAFSSKDTSKKRPGTFRPRVSSHAHIVTEIQFVESDDNDEEDSPNVTQHEKETELLHTVVFSDSRLLQRK